MAYTSSVHVSNMVDSFGMLSAFLEEPRLILILQLSVFVKLDNYLLRVNPNSYCMYNFKIIYAEVPAQAITKCVDKVR